MSNSISERHPPLNTLEKFPLSERTLGRCLALLLISLNLVFTCPALAQPTESNFQDIRLSAEDLGTGFKLEIEQIQPTTIEWGTFHFLSQHFTALESPSNPHPLHVDIRYGLSESMSDIHKMWFALVSSPAGTGEPNQELGDLGDVWLVSMPEHVRFLEGQTMVSITLSTRADTDVFTTQERAALLKHIKDVALKRVRAKGSRLDPFVVSFSVLSQANPVHINFQETSPFALFYTYLVTDTNYNLIVPLTRAVTEDEGEVVVDSLPPGNYVLTILVQDTLERKQEFRHEFAVQGNGGQDATLPARKGPIWTFLTCPQKLIHSL